MESEPPRQEFTDGEIAAQWARAQRFQSSLHLPPLIETGLPNMEDGYYDGERRNQEVSKRMWARLDAIAAGLPERPSDAPDERSESTG